MDTQIVFVYGLCDDRLNALQHGDDPHCQVSDAEILTTARVAALYFGGPFRRACLPAGRPRRSVTSRGSCPGSSVRVASCGGGIAVPIACRPCFTPWRSLATCLRAPHRQACLPCWHRQVSSTPSVSTSLTVFRSRSAITFGFGGAGVIRVQPGGGINRAGGAISMV